MNNRTQKKLDKSGVLVIADMQRRICFHEQDIDTILLHVISNDKVTTLKSSDNTVNFIIKKIMEMKAELTELRKLKPL